MNSHTKSSRLRCSAFTFFCGKEGSRCFFAMTCAFATESEKYQTFEATILASCKQFVVGEFLVIRQTQGHPSGVLEFEWSAEASVVGLCDGSVHESCDMEINLGSVGEASKFTRQCFICLA